MSFKWLRSSAASIKLVTGNFIVEDVATISTPVAIPGTGVFTQLTNDGAGARTDASQAPTGLVELWQTATDDFDFSQLSVGDQLFLRVNLEINILTVNTDVDIQLLAGIGQTPLPFDWDRTSYKSTGTFQVVKTSFITMRDTSILTGTAEVQAKADKACTITVKEWNYIIHRRAG